MAKFSSASARPPRTSAGKYVTTRSTAQDTQTHEGGAAFSRDDKSDLFTLGISNFVGEDTFYESAGQRDTRFAELVHRVTAADPQWVANFVAWLRSEGNMRSASAVTAAEYLAAGGPDARKVIDSALQRADEPGEIVGYWLAQHGRQLPMALKKGVSDAARRLFNEYSALKYGTESKGVSMVDVLSLAHVKPSSDAQAELFKWLFDRRYGRTGETYSQLQMINARQALKGATREKLMDAQALRAAGMTWEALSSEGPMDRAAWESVIPTMGYMALLRNLRNFDEAGVSDEVAEAVAKRLSDPEQVAKSRQLPFRFWSAYRSVGSTRWAHPLATALDASLRNIPQLDGKTLVLIDTSGSMTGIGYSARSTVRPVDTAALFGAALGARNAATADVFIFATGVAPVRIKTGDSVLPTQSKISRMVGQVGHGTAIGQSVMQTLRPEHKRVFILTDMQSADNASVPDSLFVYGCDLRGYSRTAFSFGHGRKLELPTLTDKTFSLVPLFEAGREMRWPWEK